MRGLSDTLSLVPLAAVMGALLAGRALWLLAYWRPATLSANAMELLFVSVKLGTLAVSGALLAVLALHPFARRIR